MAVQARMQAAAGRSYVTPAVISFFLYWIFWLPGFIVNLVYLSQARGDKRLAGVAPNGLGCLWAVLWVFVLGPLVFLALLALGVIGLFNGHPMISNTLNLVSNNL